MDDKENKLYSDFATRDILDGISADNFDSLKNEAYIVPENKEFFEDMLRTGWLSGQISASGPMPNTAKILVIETAVGGIHDFFIPAAGECWLVTAVSTGTMNVSSATLLLNDGATQVEVGQENAAGVVFDPTFAGNLYIDNNVYLSVSLNSITGTTKIVASFIRVR